MLVTSQEGFCSLDVVTLNTMKAKFTCSWTLAFRNDPPLGLD
jgi:hypothetical protein